MLNKPDFIDEEQNYLLNSLLTLTQKNPAIWECVEYNPLSFLSSEEDDGTISACIVQMFVFQAELNQVEFELELSEHIDITTGKGDIYITLEKQSPDSYDKIDTGLSGIMLLLKWRKLSSQQHYNRMQHPPHCNGQFLMLKVIRR